MNSNNQFQWEAAVRSLIVSVVVLCVIAPLVLYLLFSLREQKIIMGAEADILAHTITEEINKNPEYWQYEEIRFSSILRHRSHDANYQERRQLFDSNHKLVAEHNNSLQRPLIHIEARVFDAGDPVGSLRISRSIRLILQTSALILLASSICGALLYSVLHVFPLKLMRSAFTELNTKKEQATVTLNSIADGVITTDTSLRILSLNPAAAKLGGVQSAGVLGEPFRQHFKIIHPQAREKVESLLEDCLQYGENACRQREQAVLVCEESGSEFQVEITVSPLHDEQHRLLGLVIVLHDVTAACMLEKQLKEKVLELGVILKYAGVGIAFVREGIVQEVNTMISEIFGIPSEAIIGRRASSILPTYLGYTDPIEHIYTQLSKGEIFDIERQVVLSNQKPIWIRLIGQGVDPSRLSEGGSVWIAQDITQLKQYQEKLEIAKFHAEEASRFKSEFLAHISHELRNPLSGIIGINRLVLETDLTPVQQRYLTIVQESAETLLLLINNLLDLSKIEAGVMELEERSFRISTIYDYVNNIVALKIKEKGLSLTFSISEDVPLELIGDELRLGQILLNLVGNAVKFTSMGGIDVFCARIAQTESTVQLLFSVTDTGCGIDEPTRKKIFESFVQASSSVSRTHGGSGLGLSICKKLTELMGGQIGVKSELGQGSTFSFSGWFRHERQPDFESTDTGKKIPEQKKGPVQPARRILLVEDIPFNQTIAKLLLEQEEHCVEVATNGREALAALAKSTFDVIFMDVRMPEIDGLTTTRLIRRCEKERNPLVKEDNDLIQAVSSRIHGKHIPIIGMTGNSTEDGRLDCFAAGMDNYISKPFDREEMLHAMEVVYGKQMVSEV
jgi:PAS domain S-box-containing protein